MGIEDLLEKLKKQPKTVDQQFEEKKAEWIADVEKLMTDIGKWLTPLIEAKVASVEPRKVELDEPDTGPYKVDALTIHLGNRAVKVEPRGMQIVGVVRTGAARVVGARGIVDLISGPSRATILRSKDRVWQLATSDAWPSQKSAVDLTVDTFADALNELLPDADG